MAEVRLENLKKTYGTSVQAVKNLSLTVQDRELFCLLGPSGCGKSTTLAMIAGLELPTGGDIFIGDVNVTRMEARHRDIAMVFENYALYPHMTVFENMAFPLQARKMPKEEILERVTHAGQLLDITELFNRKPSELSGGQRQRVAIGRAIVRRPKVYLFDEPISHLDAKLRAHMRAELKKLVKELSTTSIYVTHDQLEAMSMADKIAIMNFGVLQQLGSPKEVFETPVNAFVAGFIGDPPINFLDCSVTSVDGEMVAEGKGFRVPLPEHIATAPGLQAVRQFQLGIRPEHLTIFAEKPDDKAVFPGTVWITEPRGDDVIVDIDLGGPKLKIKISAEESTGLEVGQHIWLAANTKRVLLFNKENGLRI